MSSFVNTQGITRIEFSTEISCFCPMGKNHEYSATIDVYMEPFHCIPDYIDIQDYIKELDGKDLIVEDLCKNVYDYLRFRYTPNSLQVSISATTDIHFPVKVTINSEDSWRYDFNEEDK